MAKAIPCPCGDAICKSWLVDPPAYLQGVSFTKEQAEAVADLLNREQVSPYERIAQVQKDLFEIREGMRDTIDDRTDSRFMRLCAEIGTLAEDFLPPPNDGKCHCQDCPSQYGGICPGESGIEEKAEVYK